MVAAGGVGVVGVVGVTGVELEVLLLEPPHPASAMERASRLPVSQQNDASRQQVTRVMVPPNVQMRWMQWNPKNLYGQSQGFTKALQGKRFGGSGNHVVGAHHVVVFVLEHVAMVDVAPGESFETNKYRENLAGLNHRRVLPPSLICSRRTRASNQLKMAQREGSRVKALSMQNLKLHEV